MGKGASDEPEEVEPIAEFTAHCCFLLMLFGGIILVGIIYGIYTLIVNLICQI